ncbi:lipid IV(A) 3-deoxy-D-manno-octulosonic acid transferase [Mycoavidus sp. B2-EB]|uniref:lipid IV(A) 3-deoxy-D-manno-octulosonic acid transferase n=1 Tax=Mycoavidus sp. B2-EB TaxID=2651972 RepID=UPI001625A1A9|nr:lipid IV(A) 3-deoxy-D-manno-octulosonic acid transferase [Mycoavidus sp. B2-EB]BBO60085.1 3-deoxy-D-manno-octulosonic acid transferase [Mycoavidus sp. B2-EB]
MLRQIYCALWWLIAPIAVLRLLWRSRRERGYARHIGERFGFGYAPDLSESGAPLLWVHAVSVGETRAAQPLIEALLTAHPEARVLLTHMTPAGRAMGEALLGTRVLRCYLPYDMPFAVRRFLARYRPVLGVVMETEVWPTLIDECRQADVPLALVNARMSERSYRRAAKFGPAAHKVFGGLARVFAQSEADAKRLSALGARQVTVLGNLKFDMTTPAVLVARGQAWRLAFGTRPVWVAASTRTGEEALILDAFKRSGLADEAVLILVPRHPQRFNEVAALLAREGWRFARRSALNASAANGTDSAQPPLFESNMQVWLGDSMGELGAYYAAAEVAFIGGSLLPFGGQNLIEACAAGVPVLIGAYTFNFEQVSADAIAAGAARRVADSAELGAALRTLLTDRSLCTTMSTAAVAFAALHRGATRRTVEALRLLLRDSN